MPTNVNLHSVVRIKTMARAAISANEVFSEDTGWEMAKAYERLRKEARNLNDRAGWGSGDEFDKEVPPINLPMVHGSFSSPSMSLRDIHSSDLPDNAIQWGRRARVLLGQLAGWAEGHQEAFELEARFQADAEARQKAAAQPPRQSPGFR